MPDRQQRFITAVIYYALLGGLIYFCARYLLVWLLPFVLGAGLAALLRPASLRLAKWAKLREKSASVLTLTLFYLAVTAIPLFFAVLLLAQLYSLLLQLPALYASNIAPLLARVGDWLSELTVRFFPEATGDQVQLLGDALLAAAQQAAVDGSSFLVGKIAGFVAGLPSLALTMIFTVVISVLTAVGYRKIAGFIRAIIPTAASDFVGRLQRFLRDTLWKLVRAYTIIMAITFLELAAGLWLLGFDYVLPIASVISIVDLLPLIGSGAVLVPWGILLLASGDLVGGVGLLLLFGVIAVARNIIEPKVVSGVIGLHPVATITAMYAGLKLGGLIGMFAAPVSLLAVLRLYRPEELH